jgi:hypothetical protein
MKRDEPVRREEKEKRDRPFPVIRNAPILLHPYGKNM